MDVGLLGVALYVLLFSVFYVSFCYSCFDGSVPKVGKGCNRGDIFFHFAIGRAALQKRIMTLLRKIEHCTPGCLQVSVLSATRCFVFVP